MARYWTCYRVSEGRKCLTQNPRVKQKCLTCGKDRPKPRKAKHLVALEAPYEHYIELNGGERCAICLRERSDKDRRLQRDHDHKTGRPRGLLCVRCNRALPHWMTAEWLRAAADYLDERRAA